MSGLAVYGDALMGDFQDWTWSATAGLKNTSPVYAGKDSLKLSISAAYGGVELHTNAGVAPGTYTRLTFAARAAAANGSYMVVLTDASDTELTSPVPLTNYGPAPSSTGWTVYTVPLNSLGGSGVTIHGIVFQDGKGTKEPALYLDNIGLQ